MRNFKLFTLAIILSAPILVSTSDARQGEADGPNPAPVNVCANDISDLYQRVGFTKKNGQDRIVKIFKKNGQFCFQLNY